MARHTPKSSRFVLLASGLITAFGLQGCATSGTSLQCQSLPDPEASVRCLNDVMFPEVVSGIGIGAAGGAVLGGAVAFAASGGRSPAAAVRGALTGGMVGGVAGGVAAYLKDLNDRTANDSVRAAKMNAANMAAANRNLELVIEEVTLMLRQQRSINQSQIINVIVTRASESKDAYASATASLPKTQDAEYEEQRLSNNVRKLQELKAAATAAENHPY